MDERNIKTNTEHVENLSIVERFNNHPTAALETYKYFNQSEETIRNYVDTVIAGGDIISPNFTYDAIDHDQLITWRESLTEILAELPDDGSETLDQLVVRENATNRFNEIDVMLLGKIQSEMDSDDPRYNIVSDQLGRHMREVYGTPDAGHYREILGLRLSELSELDKHTDVPSDVSDALEFVRHAIKGEFPVGETYKLTPEAHDWYEARLRERIHPGREAVYAAIESGEIALDESGKLMAGDVVRATKIALDAMGCSEWESALTDATNIDTTQDTKTIFIPETRQMSMEQFEQVILAHEIDQHVARRVNGDASSMESLRGTGLHGYLAYEEGSGMVQERLLSGAMDNKPSAFGFYLSGGLALGLDRGGEGRNFRQVHDIMWRMKMVADYLKTGVAPDDESRKKAMIFMAKHVQRQFRGTDGKVPGVMFGKDMMTYYLGGVEVMQRMNESMHLSEDERTEQLRVDRSVKMNPANDTHYIIARDALRMGRNE